MKVENTYVNQDDRNAGEQELKIFNEIAIFGNFCITSTENSIKISYHDEVALSEQMISMNKKEIKQLIEFLQRV